MIKAAPCVVVQFILAAGNVGCERSASTGGRLSVEQLVIGQQIFTVQLALDPASRRKGLGGREFIGKNSGMLLVLPEPVLTAAAPRDCLVSIDVAFLDAGGQVLAMSTMRPEPPRRPGESEADYEARLPLYPSRFPVQFVLEVAGGRLAELGIAPGDRLHLDWEALARRAS